MIRKSVLGIAWTATEVALLLFAVVGCSNGSSPNSEPAGRGSPACQSWQDALCSYVSKCPGADASSCEEQAKGVVCKSDAAATACATKLDAATCAAPPAGCDLLDMADPSAAVTPCQNYLSATCDAKVRCNLEPNQATCLVDEQTGVDCSTIYSVNLSYETCLQDLTSVSCESLSKNLPASCQGILYGKP